MLALHCEVQKKIPNFPDNTMPPLIKLFVQLSQFKTPAAPLVVVRYLSVYGHFSFFVLQVKDVCAVLRL